MQYYKSVRAEVIICDILVNIQTHRHTVRQTHRQTDRQLLTCYTISSASLANKNYEHVILATSFVICMTLCYIKVFLTLEWLFVSLCNLP